MSERYLTIQDADLNGVLLIDEMAALLRMSERTIRKALQAGTFPIEPMPTIAKTPRWWGPNVRAWLQQNADPAPPPPRQAEDMIR